MRTKYLTAALTQAVLAATAFVVLAACSADTDTDTDTDRTELTMQTRPLTSAPALAPTPAPGVLADASSAVPTVDANAPANLACLTDTGVISVVVCNGDRIVAPAAGGPDSDSTSLERGAEQHGASEAEAVAAG